MCNNQLPEGFIPWHSGNNPVPGKKVIYMMRNGQFGNGGAPCHSKELSWLHPCYGDEEEQLWPYDIIGYKVVDDPSSTTPPPFSTKFRVGMTYKTRNGEVEYKLAAIIPEAKRPLVFLDVDSKSATMRDADGRMSDTKNYFSDWDIVIGKRTVYINLHKGGFSCWYDTAHAATKVAGKNAEQYLRIALPVKIEE